MIRIMLTSKQKEQLKPLFDKSNAEFLKGLEHRGSIIGQFHNPEDRNYVAVDFVKPEYAIKIQGILMEAYRNGDIGI